MSRILLAVDPGECSGWALGVDGRIVRCGACHPDTAYLNRLSAEVSELLCHIEIDSFDFVVERPQVYRKSKADPNDIVTLSIVVGLWLRQFADWQRWTVLPRTWKGQVEKEVCHRRLLARLDEDEQAVLDRDVGQMSESKANNVFDAIGILKWADSALARKDPGLVRFRK